MNVRWTQKAEESYEKIILNILENWNLEIALRLENSLNNLIHNLEDYSYFCPPSRKHKKLRRCVLSSQTSLVYEIENDVILILLLIDHRSGHPY